MKVLLSCLMLLFLSGCPSTYFYFTEEIMSERLDNYVMDNKDIIKEKKEDDLESFIYISCKGFKDYNDCNQGYAFFEKEKPFEIEFATFTSYIQEYKKEKNIEIITDYEERLSFSGKEYFFNSLSINVISKKMDILLWEKDDFGNYIQEHEFSINEYNLKVEEKNKKTYFQINGENIILLWL
jgi:hypothetical protein